MLNVTGKNITVFDVEDKGKYISANLSTSKKNRDDTYTRMSWKARFVGEAFEKAKSLCDKDKIEITNGAIENSYDKDAKKLWLTVIVFDFV